MDESVVRAMARWPNVPDCHGWLALTRRGEWRIGAQRERIAHAGLVDFINRNYVADASGGWYFQNGPQRVWVSLDYAPLVFRLLDGYPIGMHAHTGAIAQRIDRVLLDDEGSLLFATELGPGLLDDRDLPRALEMLRSADGRPFEAVLDESDAALRFGPDALPVERIAAADIEAVLGFRRVPGTRADATSRA